MVRAAVVLEAFEVDGAGEPRSTNEYYLAVEKYAPMGRGGGVSTGGGTVWKFTDAPTACLVSTEDVECSAVILRETGGISAMPVVGTGTRWRKLHAASARLMGAMLT